eukprot:GEZU01019825.1.p1 GENE.GEZU01019825.1~~GEZU01019825.1.p1  ORF type:complete len:211 (+),score=34.48 GEZU01019825.1:108-740(+)
MSTKKKQHEKVFELSEEDCLRLAREEQEEEKRRQDEIAARAREKAQKEQRKRREKLLRPILYAIVGIIWSLLFYLFIRLEFGTVFFIVSAMGAIAFSMNYDANNKDSYRLSPWSVFNKGFQALPGTFTANQLENALRGGMLPPAHNNLRQNADGGSDDDGDAQQQRVKLGRNEKCSCGSGKKYKHCCGSATNMFEKVPTHAPVGAKYRRR